MIKKIGHSFNPNNLKGYLIMLELINSWQSTEQLVILALGDEDVEINTKVDKMNQLVVYSVPQAFRQ